MHQMQTEAIHEYGLPSLRPLIIVFLSLFSPATPATRLKIARLEGAPSSEAVQFGQRFNVQNRPRLTQTNHRTCKMNPKIKHR